MKKNSLFNNPVVFYTLSSVSALFALATIYVCLEDFFNLLEFLILFILLFSFLTVLSKAFKQGRKEIVKASTASLFTLCFVFHTKGLLSLLELNHYYIFSNNVNYSIMGLFAIVLFIIFTISYVNHFLINMSNAPDTKKVTYNKYFLIIVAIISLILAFLIPYNDNNLGKDTELYLIFTYIMFFFVSLLLISIETIINTFRIAKEQGNFEKVEKKLLGNIHKNENTASSLTQKNSTKKDTAKKITNKNNKKATKKKVAPTKKVNKKNIKKTNKK